MEELQLKRIPIIPLKEMCVFPDTVFHFDVEEKKARVAVEKAMAMDQLVFLTAIRTKAENGNVQGQLYEVGTLAQVKQVLKLPRKVVRVVVEGITRGRLIHVLEQEEYLLGGIVTLDAELSKKNANLQNDKENTCYESDSKDNLQNEFEIITFGEALDEEQLLRQEAMRDQIMEQYQMFMKPFKQNADMSLLAHLKEIKDLGKLLDHMAMSLPVSFEAKQSLLECADVEARFYCMSKLLQHEIDIAQVRLEVAEKTKERIEKNQREHIMRQQIQILREELGEDEASEADKYREKLDKIKASKEVKSRINKEIKRFEQISMHSSESAVEQGYIETLLELPWDKTSKELNNLEKSEKILESDHYGLDKIKERILEYLAVRQLNEKGNSPIICLVGPPGTGKTSIAKSMARAMNRKYVRICLGGVHDEAEIRGHRKTYVGAMPGRVATAMKEAGVKNPLILLDEIDKMSRDFKGDTSAAMLEVLDSEQNKQFIDHYIEIPIDLSEVVFVATANDISQIDGPLRDRMEVIEVSSYTTNEKLHIAKDYLVKKQLKLHGISKNQLTFSDKALEKLILAYTKEAGVRGLERQIAKVCRKAARQLAAKKEDQIKITVKNLKEFLGKEKYELESINKKDDIGIVRGLAWTSVGGVTLEIEVNEMPGKGEVKLTGQLGDVMKESAMAAVSYVRSVSEEYAIPSDYFEKHDLHIHIPEGATPKDGPSAGITLATAVLSAVTKQKVRADVAMTGEVTLRGRVLPIGGLKEKMLAGKLAGAKTILIPHENEKDLEEIDEEIKSGLNIYPVERMSEVLGYALADTEGRMESR